MSSSALVERQGQTHEAGDGFTRLRPLAGPLTAATAPTLRAAVRGAIEQGHTSLLVDLHAVTGVDAAWLPFGWRSTFGTAVTADCIQRIAPVRLLRQ